MIAEIAAPEHDLRTCWESLAEVEHFDLSASEGEYTRCALTAQAGIDLRPQVSSIARERGWKLR